MKSETKAGLDLRQNSIKFKTLPKLSKGNLTAGLMTGLLLGVGAAETKAQEFVQEGGTMPFGLSDTANLDIKLVDIDNDGDLDAITNGFFSMGGKNIFSQTFFYKNNSSDPCTLSLVNEPITGPDLFGLPTTGFFLSGVPEFVDIDNDGDLDAFVGIKGGLEQAFFRNISTNPSVPNYVQEPNTFALSSNPFIKPKFVDIDGDNDLDVFVVDSGTPEVTFFRNTSTNPSVPNFVQEGGSDPFGLASASPVFDMEFGDLDEDGDLDILAIGPMPMGATNADIFFLRNSSSTTPAFTNEGPSLFGLGPTMDNNIGNLELADIDCDGDLDLFVGNLPGGSVQFYRNNSPRPEPENPIPTFSQWGLIIFLLLLVNLGIITIQRKETILARARTKK